MRSSSWAFLVLLLLGSPLAWAEAGRFQFISGEVTVTHSNGQKVVARKGDPIEEGDTISSGPLAQAQLAMRDNGLIAMRPDSQMRIEIFRFSGKADGTEQGLFGLLKGGFRALTGIIGGTNKDRYKIRTATATIGIRGTDHETVYIAPPLPGERPLGPPGTYNRVNVGNTFMETRSGRLELSPNQVGFAPAIDTQPPQRLQSTPDFLKSTPGIRTSAKSDGDSGSDNSSTDSGTAAGSETDSGSTSTSSSESATGTSGESTDTSTAANTADSPIPQSYTDTAPSTTSTTTVSTVIDTPIVTPVPSGAFNPANPTGISAPAGTALAGGGVGSNGINSGAGIIGDASSNLSMLLDTSGQLTSALGNDFSYNRNGAPALQTDSKVVSDQTVRWGVYDGGTMIDKGVTQLNTKFFFMTGTSATTSANLATRMASGTLSFFTIGGFTRPIAENGAVGGSVLQNSTLPLISIANVNGAPSVTAYNMIVSDALERSWTVSLTSAQSLSAFQSGSTQNLNVSCTGCGTGTASGNAQGVVIGNPTPVGAISSYKLTAGTTSVSGALLAQ